MILGIPTLSRYDLLNDCIKTALSGTTQPDKIYIVDNGGKYQNNQVEVIRPLFNLGVARSWNLLHKLSKPHDLILCNDDIEFGRTSIEGMVKTPGHFVWGCGYSCFLIRETAWEAVGEFDENFYPAYCEDHDFQYKMELLGLHPKGSLPPLPLFGDPIKHKPHSSKAAAGGEAAVQKSYNYYIQKWGGMPGNEKFIYPFNRLPITDWSEDNYQKALNIPSDINTLLPELLRLAKECKHITQFGMHQGRASAAFIYAKPNAIITYSLKRHEETSSAESVALKSGVNFIFRIKNVLETEIEPTDLLFIDTEHTYQQAKTELELHSQKVNKYIIMHDTVTFGETAPNGGPGIMIAIREFLEKNKEIWKIKEHHTHCHGLTVLERIIP